MLLSPDTVTLDNGYVAIQDKTHKLDKFARVQLTEHQKGTVIFHKLEGQSGISDTQHDLSKPWIVSCTAIEEGDLAYNNVATQDKNTGEHRPGAFEDDGFIFHFHGKPSGVVALDRNNQRIMTEAEARLMETNFNTKLPRYTKWDFRIHEIIATDGPEARQRAMESNEQARARAEERMQNKQEEFFTRMIALIASKGGEGVVSVAELQKTVQDVPVTLTPAQSAAQKEFEEIEAEHKRDQARGSSRGESLKVTPIDPSKLDSLKPVQIPDPMKKR